MPSIPGFQWLSWATTATMALVTTVTYADLVPVGSDAQLSIVRVSPFLVALCVIAAGWLSARLTTHKECRWGRWQFLLLVSLWITLGHTLSIDWSDGNIRTYWFFMETGQATLRPPNMDTDDYAREASMCLKFCTLEIRFRESETSVWVGPGIRQKTHRTLDEMGFHCRRPME